MEDGPDGLCFNIPAPRRRLTLLLLTAWLAGWLLGEGFVVRALLGAGSPDLPLFRWVPESPDLFLLVWGAGWTIGGVLVLVIWLWLLAGRERLILKPGVLVHRYEIQRIGFSRKYDLGKLRNLRVSPEPSLQSSGQGRWYVELVGGVVAFDYGEKTIRFGASLDEAEGQMIVGHIKGRCGIANVAG
jgi:hypothetical protein